ncbi:MAG: glycosyltransferase family 2 protein [Hydrogenophaga sp.]|uniref:glycosyltransferase family 2 protein n=1 Tax=Hydrogenophaga sp. TaxID=1904254 RepID=UPI001DD05950|nr:glycosyltransferase family 2 protein [Hydrogenophaga sp.]MBX3610052.1 glycosyltransferase family 2 protein [Hydrogenophaga sp.]
MPDPLDRVTVVLVTFHSAHCLDALHALLAHCPHIVVSDNGSSDGTPGQVRSRWPQAQVLEHGRNLGFGAANNRALAQVKTPYAFLLNPDCEVTPDGLRELVRVADDMPDAAIVAPQLCAASGQPEANYRWPGTVWASRGPGADAPACVGFVVGAAMLFRMERFSDLGFFDERFFLYYEDDDLCLRLFQNQRPMIVWPAVQAIHRSRGSVKGNTPWRSEYLRGYHHAQSKLTYTVKHRSLALARSQRWRVLLTTSLALPLRAIAWSPRLLARMAGRWMGLAQWRPYEPRS